MNYRGPPMTWSLRDSIRNFVRNIVQPNETADVDIERCAEFMYPGFTQAEENLGASDHLGD